MSVPTTSVALQITQRKQTAPLTLARVEIPALEAHELLVENVAVSQAAGDTKMVDYDMLPSVPFTIGWDCSGKVLAVGTDVKNFKVGDRVTSLSQATSPSQGSYQTHTIVRDQVTSKIPSSLSHEAASTISLAFGTSFAGLHFLSIPPGGTKTVLPLPAQPDAVAPVLVWGAGSSVGAMAVQLIKLSGYRVIATASKKNFDYVKSLGADFVVDYHDGKKAVEEIKEFAAGKLSLVYDSISLPSSIPFAIKAVGPEGGKVVVDIPGMDKFDKGGRDDVELIYAGGYNLGTVPELFDSFELLSDILQKELLVIHPIEIIPGGLSGVDKGWKRARAGEISAQKLVYRIVDTPGLASI